MRNTVTAVGIEAEIQDYEAQVAVLDAKKADLLERLSRARALLRAMQEYIAYDEGTTEPSPEPALPTRDEGRQVPIWRLIVDILTEHGQPLTLEEIVNEVQQRGGRFTAQRPKNSVSALAHQRSELVVRKGKMALSEWKPTEEEDGAPVPTKRRRKAKLSGRPRQVYMILKKAARPLSTAEIHDELRRESPDIRWGEPDKNLRHIFTLLRQAGVTVVATGGGRYEVQQEPKQAQIELPSPGSEGNADGAEA